jgi:IclR family transcriptional regulator, acetate operon repressor
MAIQVIDRAVRILRVVARRGPSSLTEISVESRLPVPTAARILQSLVDNGILRRLDNKTYHLGARLVPLSTRLEPFRQSLEISHPTIEGLSRATSEDCGLAVLQGNEAVVVDWCYGPNPPRIIEPYSREIPLYCAFGKVLIAFQPAQWRNRFLQNAQLHKIAAGTVRNRTVLSSEIERIRRTGVHISLAENVEGAGSLSVPVFDTTSHLLGALFVTAPLERFGERKIERYRHLLFEAAAQITSGLQRQRRRDRPERAVAKGRSRFAAGNNSRESYAETRKNEK